jgi:hypothetical protein
MPPFTLQPKGRPHGIGANDDVESLTPAGGRAPERNFDTTDPGSTGISDIEPNFDPDQNAGMPGAHSTRNFGFTYEPSPSVGGPMGPQNIGYSHNVVSTEGQWARGELPDLGYSYAFALRRPRLMREPRTDIGSYNLARG